MKINDVEIDAFPDPCVLFVSRGVICQVDADLFDSDMLTGRDRALALALLEFAASHLRKDVES